LNCGCHFSSNQRAPKELDMTVRNAAFSPQPGLAAQVDNGRVQLLTRTGLDWTDKYPSAVAALANVKTAYIDGELCGVDEAGLPSFAHTQAATDGEGGVHVVYYAFDLLHVGG
jgi:bifunctional non-homologous end joining protein LigD